MWGMGIACSLLLLAVTCSWAIEGRIGYRLRLSRTGTVGEIRSEEAPVRFWFITGFCIAVSAASAIVTGIGLSRVQRDEDKPA